MPTAKKSTQSDVGKFECNTFYAVVLMYAAVAFYVLIFGLPHVPKLL